MELKSDKNQVLSAIEQSIQNALSLFDFKSLLGGGGGNTELLCVDDPIVSLHDTTVNDPNFQAVESNGKELQNVLCPSDEVYSSIYQQPKVLHNNIEHRNQSLSYESISLPENPISKTIEEMKRVLNTRGDCFLEIAEPSPEEILNLYSENLGISCDGSPRGVNMMNSQHQTSLGNFKPDKNRHDKINLKQLKSKLNTETKLENKKGKIYKSDMQTSKENKLRELINVYGVSEKNRKTYANLTLHSKSEENKKISSNTLKPLNGSRKVSSISSRKSKRKNKKQTDENYLNDVVLEKSSRLGSKRKTNSKGNVSNLKKVHLKRKPKLNIINDNIEPKISKDFPDYSKQNKHCCNKVNSSNTNKHLQLIKKSSNQKNKKVDYYPQERKRNTLTTDINDNCLNVTSHKRQYIEPENNSVKPKNDLDSFQNHSNQYQKRILASKEMGINILNEKASTEEANLNKHIFFSKSDSLDRNDYTLFVSHDSQNDSLKHETLNEGFVSKSSPLHYALPTQSSRSKEVERFLNGHYQHLPFVIGQSTSKSHNLWVNIQEALSLIKQKLQHPTESQNTTYNGCVEYERPPSVLSKLTTKTIRKPHQCPAIRSDSLYDIPEGNLEIEDTGVSSWENHPECIKANVDPNYAQSRCSCLAQPVMNYKNVLRQIFGGNSEGAMDSNLTIDGLKGDVFYDQGGDSYITELKKVLIRFTQDFEDMNNKYEEMLLDPNSSKEELKQLEVQLENKEEEIKEIIARFNEVKEFNAGAHLEESKGRAGLYNLDAFKSTTSIRLAQTLHRVQQFKESLKGRPSVPYLARHNHILST